MEKTLAPETTMGAVTLKVADLDEMTTYYGRDIGLDVLAAEGPRVTLGRGTTPVVVLEHAPALRHAGPREAGLFHTALLFDSPEALAAAVHSVARARPGSFVGSSDHLVSRAFYFDDPEGNGVELYTDRDRSQWRWTGGQVEMATMFLDPREFLRGHLTEEGLAGPLREDATVGHVHLSVGDVATARSFYVDALGFEQTTAVPGGALFVSAGGYHHHMAMNVWNSRGAIVLPEGDELARVTDRLRGHGLEVRDDGRTVEVEDPWGNLLRLGAPDRG